MIFCCPLLVIYRFPNFTSAVSVFLTKQLKKMTETAVAGQLDVLIKRLNEAEKKAKLLNLEVTSIRQEISSLQSIIQPQNRTLANTKLLSKRSYSDRRTILLEDTPNKTLVDGLCKRLADEDDLPDSKKYKSDFNKENNYVIVYTDGACENNGKPNAKAGIGVWFGDTHPLNISKPVEGRATNNTAEIQACIQALRVLQSNGESKVKIHTDSEFTINCMTKWIKNWKKNNWKTASGGDVKNKEDLQLLDAVIQTFDDVKWIHVAGHNGIRGNEEADRLAREGAQHYKKSR